MTKRETIDRIVAHNPSAKPEFLAQFTSNQLRDYLRQLESLGEKRGHSSFSATCGAAPAAT